MLLAEFYNSPILARELLKGYLEKLNPKKFPFEICMAQEIEFSFLEKKKQIEHEKLEEICQSAVTISQNNGVLVNQYSKEVGNNQFEVNFKRNFDLLKLADDNLKFKEILTEIADNNGVEVVFSAKPLGDLDVGNGLHLHLSLWHEGKNLFVKKENQENPLFLSAIAGQLDSLKSLMLFYISKEQDFKRYKEKFEIEKEQVRYKNNATNAPTHIAWGKNNRTTAIRIPTANAEDELWRIENRMASSSACPYLAIFATIYASLTGVEKKLKPVAEIWGNAFDKQYKLEPLPIDLREAEKYYKKSKISKYVNKFLKTRI
jgi:glutamine synthetase